MIKVQKYTWAYMMNVITETIPERTWWMLLQKRVVRTELENKIFDVFIQEIV